VSHARCVVLLASMLIAPMVAGAGVPKSAAATLEDVSARVAKRSCSAIAQRVDAVAGTAPLLLRSYDGEHGVPDEPALRTAAFTYDNALAVIALLACDRRAQAIRIGSALEHAATGDSRLRNTYRAGVMNGNVLPNGWWDAAANRWNEDAYQSGTSTGNVAWAALAFLALHEATGDAHWRDAAVKLADWIVANTRESGAKGGFTGGIEGFDAAPIRLGWKSTEHAIDLVAVFSRLDGSSAEGPWRAEAAHARSFVDAEWDAPSGHFLIGTLPDGVSPNRTTSALDIQWWSQLLADAPAEWRRAIDYAQRHHGVGDGFDFNNDRDGVWLEGTAQAALAYRVAGQPDNARRCLAEISSQFSAGGYVFATREPQITTGLAIGQASTSADFYYYRRPHLAATAWAALAALDRNPYRAVH